MKCRANSVTTFGVAMMTLLGCQDSGWVTERPDDSEDVSSAAEPLMQYGTFSGQPVALWPNGKVPVCFSSLGTSTEAAWVKEALADTWSAVAVVDFTYSNTCPFPSESAYVQVIWDTKETWKVGGSSYPGKASPQTVHLGRCTANCTPTVDYQEAFKLVATHEFGHVLGFTHEHQRGDRSNVPASCLPAMPQKTDADASGNLLYPTDAIYQAALAKWNDNYAVIGDGIALTALYDPDSIMNYCRGYTTDYPYMLGSRSGYYAAEKLSVADLYGIQQTAYGVRLPSWLQLPTF